MAFNACRRLADLDYRSIDVASFVIGYNAALCITRRGSFWVKYREIKFISYVSFVFMPELSRPKPLTQLFNPLLLQHQSLTKVSGQYPSR